MTWTQKGRVNDPQDSFGVPHLAYLTLWVSRHLPPFPVEAAFPLAEYYGGSVTLCLAARRVIPYSLDARRLERDVGASAVSFNAVIPHRSSCGRFRRRRLCRPIMVTLPRGVVGRGCTLPSLETEVWAVGLSPYRAGLAEPGHKRLLAFSALATCYCPLWFSPPGESLTQGACLPNPSFL
jgi:hypothetical protein